MPAPELVTMRNTKTNGLSFGSHLSPHSLYVCVEGVI